MSYQAVITPNQYLKGSDSDRIEAAIADALKSGINSIEIPRYNNVGKKAEWLIDRAIVVPSDFTLNLNDCLVRLSPGTKDNIITNAGARTRPISENKNIRILGRGNAVLSGGLEAHFDPPGDRSGFRTIGILLYNTKHFTLEGFKMEETQAWAISVENGCAYGRIANIDFYNTNKYPNQDGVDIRKGCHDIVIENITGMTGDDTVALTGVRGEKGMEVGSTEEGEDIYNISINNIRAKSVGGHGIIRLLNQDGIKLFNIFISNVIDTSIDGEVFANAKRNRHYAAIRIGDVRYWTIRPNILGETYNIFIDNVISRSETIVQISGTLKNSVLRNIVGYGGNSQLVTYGTAPVESVSVDAKQF
ncbi:MAG: hypothetical protein WC384_20960 [Prolixibacteraceae bacterium]